MSKERIYLSPPHQTGGELEAFERVLNSNWLAPVGPDISLFEKGVSKATGFKYAVATTSGTAALHLALNVLGVESGHSVLTSTMTFVGAVNPITYQSAEPIFVDSDARSWNLDTQAVEKYLNKGATHVGAIIPTHLYGMPADARVLETLGNTFEVPVIHDLAECLAGRIQGKRIGEHVQRGILSFNGNKLITTSGGGAFVTNNNEEAERALYLATQAKSNTIEYHHEAVGYNYRMSNVLASLGLEQLSSLEGRVKKKKQIFHAYQSELLPLGFEFQQEVENTSSDRWLTCVLFDENRNVDIGEIVKKMDTFNIEVRPLWKPMHLQPIYQEATVIGGGTSETLYNRGLCLPSGCGLSESQLAYVIEALRSTMK